MSDASDTVTKIRKAFLEHGGGAGGLEGVNLEGHNPSMAAITLVPRDSSEDGGEDAIVMMMMAAGVDDVEIPLGNVAHAQEITMLLSTPPTGTTTAAALAAPALDVLPGFDEQSLDEHVPDVEVARGEAPDLDLDVQPMDFGGGGGEDLAFDDQVILLFF